MKAVNYFPNKLHLRSYNELDLNTPLLWNIEVKGILKGKVTLYKKQAGECKHPS